MSDMEELRTKITAHLIEKGPTHEDKLAEVLRVPKSKLLTLLYQMRAEGFAIPLPGLMWDVAAEYKKKC